MPTSSACVTVATGGVGESGASSFLNHTVGGPTSKMIVLRTAGSSLCGNTGAVAVLCINGVPAAAGNMTASGSTIQTEAPVGARVAAIVHTVPLFNSIVCVRLGELSVELDECDLVRTDRTVAPKAGIETRDWYAWNNTMPPKPDDFHVTGEVQVGNPGVDVLLTPRTPQGFNPRVLLLDLVLAQRPGLWPQVVVWKPARYDKTNADYDQVQIFHESSPIATIDVEIIR